MIKELNELVWLVSRKVDRAEEHLAFLCKNKTEVMQLYRAVCSGDFRTDDEAIKSAGIGERTSYKKYGKVLYGHLRQLVLFLSPSDDPYTRVRDEGFKAISVMKLVDFNSCKHTARQIAIELMENGLKYDRPEWVVAATDTLMGVIVSAGDKPSEFDYYESMFNEHKTFLDWEQKAALCFNRARVKCIQKKSFQSDLFLKTQTFLETLSPMATKVPSLMFNLSYFLVACNQYFTTGDYTQAAKVLDEATQYFQSRPYRAHPALLILFYRKALCYTQLGMYKEGEEAINQAIELSTEGTINWFAILEVHYYLSMRTGYYEQALKVYQLATGHKRFSAQREATREVWNILGAYIFIAYRLSGRTLPEKGLSRFRSAKFLNEVPVFSHDKNGLNIAVLIAHALLQLVEGKTDEIWERVEALEKYRERYLRGKETQRSEMFVKILVAMARADFRPARYESKVAPTLKRLKEVAYDMSNQPHEMEIIPFLTLYELARRFSSPPTKSEMATVSKTNGKDPLTLQPSALQRAMP